MTTEQEQQRTETSYRRAERERQARWIVDHPYDYTDREIRRAADLLDRLKDAPPTVG